jgi:hypothetical protein
MYAYVIKFSDGKRRSGRTKSLSYFNAELWAFAREARARKESVDTIDVWRVRK